MNEQEQHNNPWADKLNQLPTPDVNAGWDVMHKKLDQELPLAKKDNRWMFGLLIFALLIGICTCPGVLRDDENANDKNLTQRKQAEANQEKRTPTSKKYSGKGGQNVEPGATQQVKKPAVSTNGDDDDDDNDDSSKQVITSGNKERTPRQETGDRTALKPVTDNVRPQITASGRKGKTVSDNSSGDVSLAVKRTQLTGKRRSGKIDPPITTAATSETVIERDLKRVSLQPADLKTFNGMQLASIDPTLLKKKNRFDSLKDSKSSDTAKKQNRGFVVAAGINQFFPIGDQQKSSFNSSGQSGTWTDYLPVPQVKYYFSDKFYVQAEAQFNAPQYTKELIAHRELSDTNVTVMRRQRSVIVKKLFYFNLPLSVHVSPIKNVNIGTGIQFSRLSNAVGLSEERQLIPNRPDSIQSAKIQSIKSDSVYQRFKTNEFRLLADLNYQWKNVQLGVRYNQALSKFINIQLPNGQITQARNSALQLYVRYTIWDQRKQRYN